MARHAPNVFYGREIARDAGLDDLARAAGVRRDDRAPGGERLEMRPAERLRPACRGDERDRAPHERDDGAIRYPAEHADMAARRLGSSKCCGFFAVTGNHERGRDGSHLAHDLRQEIRALMPREFARVEDEPWWEIGKAARIRLRERCLI